MRLKINNFAKIKSANIIIDGITVIAGENNTGKSTVGKVLFSLFNASSDMEKKIAEQRRTEIGKAIHPLLLSFCDDRIAVLGEDRPELVRLNSNFARKILSALSEKSEVDHNYVRCVVEELLASLPEGKKSLYFGEILNNSVKKIIEIHNLPQKTIMLEILTRYFHGVFNGQVNSLADPASVAKVSLTVKGENMDLSFLRNACTDIKDQINIRHKAIYIDNPFVVDNLNNSGKINPMEDFLKDLLKDKDETDILDGIIETVLAKERLNEVYQALQTVIDGQIIEKKGEGFYLTKDGLQQPVLFNNLSTGLKSFVIIKMLVERGLIREKDVLILDEPEIHLHPQWQVAYAELIVLLQKYFDLSIVVTTHSPYFLDAINIFSVKHGLGSKVNYYLASMEAESVKMDCVTGNMELIYQKMASPIQMLDTLRYELNHI